MAPWLAGRPEPVVINYHSVTPPEYFKPWNNGIARLQVGAQTGVARLAPRADWASPSPSSTGGAAPGRLRPTVVIPVAKSPCPRWTRSCLVDRLRARHPAADPVAVGGRLAPNKGHHRTIAALFVARATPTPGPPDPGGHAVRAHLRPSAPPLCRCPRPGRRGRLRRRSQRCRTGRRLPGRRCAGDAVRARGLRRAPGRGDGPRSHRRRLRRRGVGEVLGDAGVVLSDKPSRHGGLGGGRDFWPTGARSRLVGPVGRFEALGLDNAGNAWWRRSGASADQPPGPVTGDTAADRLPAEPEPLGLRLWTTTRVPSCPHRRPGREPPDQAGVRGGPRLGHLPAPAQGADRLLRLGDRPEHRQPGLLPAHPARGGEPGA